MGTGFAMGMRFAMGGAPENGAHAGQRGGAG
jgi:hypothetical protein